MGVSIERSLGESSCQGIHISLKAAVSKEEPVTPNSQPGSWGCHRLVVLIPCRRHLLQDAAPYRESNKSCRHSNDNTVIKKIM